MQGERASAETRNIDADPCTKKCKNENFEKSGRALDFWRSNLDPK